MTDAEKLAYFETVMEMNRALKKLVEDYKKELDAQQLYIEKLEKIINKRI